MRFTLAFDPLLPDWAMIACGAAAVLVAALYLISRARGAGWRIAALGVLILALAQPLAVETERSRLKDIAVIVTDTSQSQDIGERARVTAETAAALKDRLARDPTLDVRTVNSGKAGADGTTLFDAASRGLADVPPDRLAGVILVTDGQVQDAALAAQVPGRAPVHALITGKRGERDRRLTLVEAPRFGLVGKEVEFVVRIDDEGAEGAPAELSMRVDGGPAVKKIARTGDAVRLPVLLSHAGENIIEIEVNAGPNELTLLNNRVAAVANGVRDRLRVLLVSGEPHAGERAWRNLLKADPAVDLVHFTILRPPDKQDGTPIEELSLIAFPTTELFEEKIGEFDLIIFDRYQRLGILPNEYYANIVGFVRDGGALLVASGPDFAEPGSIYDSPLGDILPAAPTGAVTEQAYRPMVTTAGERHPVTAALPGANQGPNPPSWGRWLRVADAYKIAGDVVMEAPGQRPLLVLNSAGEGRVALLLSDHSWLWTRGYDGGGPASELLRRLSHWLMKEPELEEERLTAEVSGEQIKITRRTMAERAAPVTIAAPGGSTSVTELSAAGPGIFTASVPATEIGVYRISDGTLSTVAASGALNPKEYADVRASADLLLPHSTARGGGVLWLEDGLPGLRRVPEDARLAGANWLGLVDHEAYAVASVRRTALLHPMLAMLLAMGLWILAWRQEGR